MTLRCDLLQGNPTPLIRWFADDVLVEEDPTDDAIIIFDNGMFLFIRQLTAEQRATRFHCLVTNFEGEVFRDPNTFVLSNDISQSNTLVEYRFSIFPFLTAGVGVPATLVYSAAAVDSAGDRIDLQLSCPSTSEIELSVSNSLIITATLQPPAATLFDVFFTCRVIGGGIDQLLFGSVQVARECKMKYQSSQSSTHC